MCTERIGSISTTDLIGRVLSNYDYYMEESIKKGFKPRELGINNYKYFCYMINIIYQKNQKRRENNKYNKLYFYINNNDEDNGASEVGNNFFVFDNNNKRKFSKKIFFMKLFFDKLLNINKSN